MIINEKNHKNRRRRKKKYIFTHDWLDEFHIRWVICLTLCVLIWDDVTDGWLSKLSSELKWKKYFVIFLKFMRDNQNEKWKRSKKKVQKNIVVVVEKLLHFRFSCLHFSLCIFVCVCVCVRHILKYQEKGRNFCIIF